MIAWKKHLAATRGVSWRDRWLIKTDTIGSLGSMFAPIANWTLGLRFLRGLIESWVGVHRDRQVLRFSPETFLHWWERRGASQVPASAPRKVAFFGSCMVNYQATDVGKATIQVLEKNGVHVVVPEQRCCGMPSFDIGDAAAIQQAASANVASFLPWVEKGYDIVAPVPSCSLMWKREYPEIVGSDAVRRVAERTFDISEYLMRLKRDGALATDFQQKPGRVAYQVPCHLRDQNIGFKSKELMECAGAQVEVIEKCSGHDGAWSAKTEFFPLSMLIAQKAVRAIEQAPADLVASDCPLAGLQLDQAGAMAHAGGRATRHPIQIVRDAYGLGL
jgi:Fe-S oxidoreductase